MNLKFTISNSERKKGIKVKYTVAYSLEMMTIAEGINGLITTKAHHLLLNANLDISEKFWPAAFNSSI